MDRHPSIPADLIRARGRSRRRCDAVCMAATDRTPPAGQALPKGPSIYRSSPMASKLAAAMIAGRGLPDVEEAAKDTPKRRSIPDDVPPTGIELSPARDDCAACAGALRRIGEDVTEEVELGETGQQTVRGAVCPSNGRVVVNPIVRARFAAGAARPSRNRRYGHGPSSVAGRGHDWSLVCSSARTAIISRLTNGPRSSSATASTSTARRWPSGQEYGPTGAAGRGGRPARPRQLGDPRR